MSVGPEALRRFGPLLFLACPTGVPDCCACPTGVPGAGEPGRPRDLASSLRSAPRLEARPGPPGPPAPSTPVGLWWLTLLGASSRSPARPRRRPPAPQPGPPIPPAPTTPVGLWWLTLIGASSRSPSRPHRRPRAPQPGPPIPPAHSTPVGLWWLTLLGASSRSPARPRRRPPAPQQALPIVPCSLHRWRWDFTELGAGCRRAGVLMMQNSRLVALKPRREAVWRSKCRPPR